MNSRTSDRIAALVSLALLAALALFTFYLAQVAERQNATRTPERARTGEPDYFVERLALLGMNERGQPSFRLEARQLQHFPDDDVTVFEEPVMVSLDPERPRVTVTADRGRLTEGGDAAHLSGNVVVTRAATPSAAPLKAETEYAIVYPERDLIRTDREVTVIQGGSRLTGVGMELDNRSRELRVDSRVRGVWQAPERAPATAAGAPRGTQAPR
jgi:lipopolysaccharide export system protein LptC